MPVHRSEGGPDVEESRREDVVLLTDQTADAAVQPGPEDTTIDPGCDLPPEPPDDSTAETLPRPPLIDAVPAEVVQEVVEPIGCLPGEGCFLDPCNDNGDCMSGWCVNHMGAGLCTVTCIEECPAGWTCTQVAGVLPDVVYVCISDFSNLCIPCSQGDDCTALSGATDVCADYGPGGNFCGAECAGDNTCPWGFACMEVVSTEGEVSAQCVAEAGVCPCTEKSALLARWTLCEIANEWGVCIGMRICTDEGLTPCDAPVPSAEECNGADDDCDGEVDEGCE